MISLDFRDLRISAPGIRGLVVFLAVFAGAHPVAADLPGSPAHPTAPVWNIWDSPRVLEGAWKVRSGDSSGWAALDHADSHWDSAPLWKGPAGESMGHDDTAWYRMEVLLPAKPGPGKTLGLLHPPQSTQEYYWDGLRIGRPAAHGKRMYEERIGGMELAAIPEDLTGPGRHVLAVRMTGYQPIHLPHSRNLTLGETTALELKASHEMMILFFLAGVMVFGAVYRFLNYRAAGYGRNTVLFSIFVLSCAATIVLQYLGAIVDLDPGQRFAAQLGLSVAWYFMISLVPDYFIFAEAFPYPWLLPVLLIGGLFVAIPMGFMHTGYAPLAWKMPIFTANHVYLLLSLATSLWVIGWAVWRKQTGSGLALLGILSMVAGGIASYVFSTAWPWAAGVAAHVIFLARVQSGRIAERMAEHRETDLRSARLEIELLKKNIQPHFLLNSLNSIIAWLEEEPRTAARLVNALADELGMLLRISSQKTIPLEEEINLCRVHLQVMGLRQDKTYSLDCTGLAGGERVPPMVLHTLVENGLTHGYVGKMQGSFRLRREDIAGGMRLTLFNDGKPREKKEKKGEGTGLRYVRSRLEEAFPGRWSLASGPVENGWEVALDIRHGKD